MGDIAFEVWSVNDKKLVMAANKKVVTRKWFKSEPPTTEEWIEIIYITYRMENMYFFFFSYSLLYYVVSKMKASHVPIG